MMGLEIHQQLDTRKLFCSCPSIIREDPPDFRVFRELRVAEGEMGEIDRAALFEEKRQRKFVYEGYRDTTCLVELDEEPPGPMNPEALRYAVHIARMLRMKLVDEVHVMRKIVVDGSNTTGFQRTALIGVNGWVEVEGRKVGIKTLCLEEDSARIVGKEGDRVVYRLDRLGIPLVEIATEPVENDPKLIRALAERIGMILRATGYVKRGLGTIRQDLNVSVEGGARVEIKGVQELEILEKAAEYEILRQRRLLEIRDELRKRGASVGEIVDVSNVFKGSKSRIVRDKRVYGIPAPGFQGLLGREVNPGRRFGTELADYARAMGAGGILHSDELPGYGITEEEVEELKKLLGEAFVLVVENKRAAEYVRERMIIAIEGVPEETRAVNPDGTSRFLRPLPGGARMYPETDVPPVKIPGDWIRESLPPYPEEIVRRIAALGIDGERAWRIFRKGYHNLVLRAKNPRLATSLVLNTLVSLKREGVPVERLGESEIEEALEGVGKYYAKEALEDILRVMAEQRVSAKRAAEILGLKYMGKEEVEEVVRELSKRYEGKALLAEAMKALRGKADGRVIAEVVRKLSSRSS